MGVSPPNVAAGVGRRQGAAREGEAAALRATREQPGPAGKRKTEPARGSVVAGGTVAGGTVAGAASGTTGGPCGSKEKLSGRANAPELDAGAHAPSHWPPARASVGGVAGMLQALRAAGLRPGDVPELEDVDELDLDELQPGARPLRLGGDSCACGGSVEATSTCSRANIANGSDGTTGDGDRAAAVPRPQGAACSAAAGKPLLRGSGAGAWGCRRLRPSRLAWPAAAVAAKCAFIFSTSPS